MLSESSNYFNLVSVSVNIYKLIGIVRLVPAIYNTIIIFLIIAVLVGFFNNIPYVNSPIIAVVYFR